MGCYYTFYDPLHDMKKINEGKFNGMPFFFTDLRHKVIMFPDNEDSIDYCFTGIMDRNMAMEYQKEMNFNQTLFTDMMDEHNTNCLVYRIE